MVPNGGMLGRNFLIGFVSMDFIGFLVLLGWLLRGRSDFCPLGLFCGLFSIFGVQNWNFLGFRRFWFVVLGGCLWEYGIGSGPFFIGGH